MTKIMTSAYLEQQHYDRLQELIAAGFGINQADVIRNAIDQVYEMEILKPDPEPEPKKEGEVYQAWSIVEKLRERG